MDYIKVKAKHYLNTTFTLKEMGCLIKFQLLVSQLERPLTESEIARELPEITWRSVQGKLKEQSTSVQDIVEKVLEDCQEVFRLRSLASERMKNYRNKAKNNRAVMHNENATNKIIEENIKEDKHIGGNPYLVNLYKGQNKELLKAYPGHLGKFCLALNAALKNGWNVPAAEKRIWEVAGKDVPPWEIFNKKEGVMDNERIKRIAEIRNL